MKRLFSGKGKSTGRSYKVYEELEAKMGVNEELTRRKQALYVGMGNTSKRPKNLKSW
ncbi:MAG: hypothetical protein R2769_08665 [Saprospiraceae bacterium]